MNRRLLMSIILVTLATGAVTSELIARSNVSHPDVDIQLLAFHPHLVGVVIDFARTGDDLAAAQGRLTDASLTANPGGNSAVEHARAEHARAGKRLTAAVRKFGRLSAQVTGPHVVDGNWARDMTDARRIIEVSARIVAFSASNPLPSGAEDRSASPLINEPVPTTTIPTTTTSPPTTTTLPPTTTTTRPPPPSLLQSDEFQNGLALNTPIKAAPVLDPMNPTWSAWLGSPTVAPWGPASALLYAFGLPVYYADSSTPRVQVIVDNEPGWGTNNLSQQLVPMPAAAAANSGSDGKFVVIDPVTRKVFDFWVAKLINGVWHAAWGGVYSLDGSGSSPNPDYNPAVREGVPTPTPWPRPTSRGGGAGTSSYAGLVRLREISAGVINHAMVFATAHACGPSQTGPYRYPATTTDGSYGGGDCIPQGSRIQLDPTINVDAIPGITPGEKAVAKALQRYGAYIVDNCPNQMSFAFETPKAGQADPYPAAGFTGDYYNMPHIPWARVRVLRNWQGT